MIPLPLVINHADSEGHADSRGGLLVRSRIRWAAITPEQYDGASTVFSASTVF